MESVHLIGGARVLRFDEEYNSVKVALKTIMLVRVSNILLKLLTIGLSEIHATCELVGFMFAPFMVRFKAFGNLS